MSFRHSRHNEAAKLVNVDLRVAKVSSSFCRGFTSALNSPLPVALLNTTKKDSKKGIYFKHYITGTLTGS